MELEAPSGLFFYTPLPSKLLQILFSFESQDTNSYSGWQKCVELVSFYAHLAVHAASCHCMKAFDVLSTLQGSCRFLKGFKRQLA